MLAYNTETWILKKKEQYKNQIMDMKFLTVTEGEVRRARIRYDIFREEMAFHNFNLHLQAFAAWGVSVKRSQDTSHIFK
jgi:hypothetical protein